MKTEWMGFKEARKFARGLKLKNNNEWRKYIKGKSFVLKIPADPSLTYKKKWVDWSNWLGTKNISSRKRYFLPFKEGRKVVRNLKLKGTKEWIKYIKGKTNMLKIPSSPSREYKKEWKNWNDWLGTNNKNGGQEKYTINHNFFKKWSHDMTYVFGLWFADGCIYKHTYQNSFYFQITLHEKDSYLLKDVLSIMKSSHPLYRNKKKHCVDIKISSKTIVEDISQDLLLRSHHLVEQLKEGLLDFSLVSGDAHELRQELAPHLRRHPFRCC